MERVALYPEIMFGKASDKARIFGCQRVGCERAIADFIGNTFEVLSALRSFEALPTYRAQPLTPSGLFKVTRQLHTCHIGMHERKRDGRYNLEDPPF